MQTDNRLPVFRGKRGHRREIGVIIKGYYKKFLGVVTVEYLGCVTIYTSHHKWQN